MTTGRDGGDLQGRDHHGYLYWENDCRQYLHIRNKRSMAAMAAIAMPMEANDDAAWNRGDHHYH